MVASIVLTDKQIARFWRRVRKTDEDRCWEASHKYLGIRLVVRGVGKISITAHRLAYILAYGSIPDGLWVLHTCDNPRCCRPDHLFLGTQLDNMRDMQVKGRGRYARGEKQGHSKLTTVQVVEIRRRYSLGGTSQQQLATEYGVSRAAVWEVIHGTTWAHI